jgi:hypothetical protein
MIQAVALRRFNTDGRYFEADDAMTLPDAEFRVLEGMGYVRRAPARKKIAR